MKSRVVAFWVLVCLCSHVGGSSAGAQAKPASARPAQTKPAESKPAQTKSAPATGAETQAREAFERGRIHYDNGDFARAATAFEEAYRLSGREGLLYNLYLAYRDANQQENAAEALRGYLTKVEVIENRAQLESRLKSLEAGIAQRKQAEAQEAERARAAQDKAQQDEQARAAQAPAAQSAPLTPVAEKSKWWVVPVAVMGAGGALMVGSLATGLLANSKAKELEHDCPSGKNCDPSLKSKADSGQTLALTTDILLFGGLATAVVGGVLLLIKKPKKQAAAKDMPQANVSCSRAGCAGSVALRF